MKKIYKILFVFPLFILSFLLGFFRSFASELPEGMYTATELTQGDSWYIYLNSFNRGVINRDMYWTGHNTDSPGYIDGSVNTAKIGGYISSTNLVIPNIGTLSYTTIRWNNYRQDYNMNYSTMLSSLPFDEYCSFTSNIPIFSNQADYNSYMNGSLGIEDALNYNKVLDNGNWIGTHKDVVFDNDLPVPVIKEANFTGFELQSVPLSPDGVHNYLYEVQIRYGFQNPLSYLQTALPTVNQSSVNTSQSNRQTPTQDNSYAITNLGYVTEDVYGSTTSFELSSFNVNVVSGIWSILDDFYNNYPTARSYINSLSVGGLKYQDQGNWIARSLYYPWISSGLKTEFRDVRGFINTYSHSDEQGLHNVPSTFVVYTVNYIYNDYDNNTIVTGRPCSYIVWGNDQFRAISYSYDKDGGLITDSTNSGTINSDGVFDNTGNDFEFNFSLNDSSSFFEYLQNVFNGVDSSFTTFASIFANVFNCLPDFIIWSIFAGIMIMIIIGIVKAIVG